MSIITFNRLKIVSQLNVDAYINHQPDWARVLLQRLRKLVTSTVPQAEESVKYTVPFYTYQGLFCFLSAKPEHVVLALCEGASLQDPFEIMSGNQKQIRHIVILQHDTFPESEIKHMLVAAARFNEIRQQSKRLGKAKRRRTEES